MHQKTCPKKSPRIGREWSRAALPVVHAKDFEALADAAENVVMIHYEENIV